MPSWLRHAAKRAAAVRFRRLAPKFKSNGGIMKLRVVVSLLGFASLFAVAAQAQDERHSVDVFAGYSYVRANPHTCARTRQRPGPTAST
jgi:hypothetical protein